MKLLHERHSRSRSNVVWQDRSVQPVEGLRTDSMRVGEIEARIVDPTTIEVVAPMHYAGRRVTLVVECRSASGCRLFQVCARLHADLSSASAKAVKWLPFSLFGINGFGLILLILG
ncbi:MAG: hypothetical protein N2651_03230 [Fimbriimonadales bacterium]|nr:hypothetical protein [Fimbriimonadales bacterium]